LKSILPYIPSVSVAIGFVVALWGGHWFLIGRHPNLGNERKFPRQVFMLGLTIAGLVATILVLPISETSRNRLIGMIGLLISGIIAFASTTAAANFMSGILLRITKPFRIGDFIRVGDHFGRVSERGLFDTEIQSESRELIAIPNAYLMSNPVITIRSSGTIISTALSLGYDVHHSKIEPLLIKAAEEIGLKEPFVHIIELGNYSITYRISGLLSEVKWLITAHSNLCRSVLDILHTQDIEIMSPMYMNQRRLNDEQKIIPKVAQMESSEESNVAEEIVFDKAERAERIEKEKQELSEHLQRLEAELKDAPEETKGSIKDDIALCRERLTALEQDEARSNEDSNLAEQTSTPDVSQKVDRAGD
jgi:small conductance mechanosensitive channel